MTPGEIRAIIYAVVALLLVAVGTWLGAWVVHAQWNTDKLAQASAFAAQQTKIIELQAERDALQTQVGKDHEQILANGASLVTGVSTSLRAVEAAIRGSPLRPAVVNTGSVQDALAGSGISKEFADAIGRVNAAIESLGASCVKVDADRTAIIGLEPTKH